jgi:hypothetical protein
MGGLLVVRAAFSVALQLIVVACGKWRRNDCRRRGRARGGRWWRNAWCGRSRELPYDVVVQLVGRIFELLAAHGHQLAAMAGA